MRRLNIANQTIVVANGNITVNGHRVTINGRNVVHGQSDPGVQGNGNVVRQERKLPFFDRIDLASCLNLVVSFADGETSVVVEAEDNLQPILSTEVRGNTLYVDCMDSFSTERELRVHVRLSHALQYLRIGGSGDAVLDQVAQKYIEMLIQGSGDIRATGQVAELRATIQGSGNVNLRSLKANDATLLVQGSGDITATVVERVSAMVQGSGDILVLGNSTHRNVISQGSGCIEFE